MKFKVTTVFVNNVNEIIKKMKILRLAYTCVNEIKLIFKMTKIQPYIAILRILTKQ